MANATSQERSCAPHKKKGVAGLPCATKSQDPSHYKPCDDKCIYGLTAEPSVMTIVVKGIIMCYL